MRLVESKYNLRVPLLGERTLLFNTLSRSLSLLEKEDAIVLDRIEDTQTLQTETGRALFAQGFAIPEHVDETGLLQQKYEQQRADSEAVTITVCPTLACNFGCDYCFQGLDKSVQKMMPWVQDGIIGLYERLLKEVPELKTLRSMWYGGEPLLKPQIIYDLADRMIEMSRAHGIDYSASMITNGSRMTREVAGELYKRGLRSVQITLDGAQEDHDARRHYLGNRGSYDVIVRNIKSWVHDYPIRIDLRVNIDERNMNGVKGLIDDLADHGLADVGTLKMYFAPVESVTKGCHSVADKMIRKLQFGALEAELLRYACERGLADLPYPPTFMGLCSALKPYDFIIVPSGDVHKCWDTVSFPEKAIGSILDLDPLFQGRGVKQAAWDSFNPFANKTCSNCKILPNCTSFCAHKFVNAGDTLGEAALPCPSLKYSINEKIILRAEKEGFITRDDYTPEMIATNPLDLCEEVFVKEDYLANAMAE